MLYIPYYICLVFSVVDSMKALCNWYFASLNKKINNSFFFNAMQLVFCFIKQKINSFFCHLINLRYVLFSMLLI